MSGYLIFSIWSRSCTTKIIRNMHRSRMFLYQLRSSAWTQQWARNHNSAALHEHSSELGITTPQLCMNTAVSQESQLRSSAWAQQWARNHNSAALHEHSSELGITTLYLCMNTAMSWESQLCISAGTQQWYGNHNYVSLQEHSSELGITTLYLCMNTAMLGITTPYLCRNTAVSWESQLRIFAGTQQSAGNHKLKQVSL